MWFFFIRGTWREMVYGWGLRRWKISKLLFYVYHFLQMSTFTIHQVERSDQETWLWTQLIIKPGWGIDFSTHPPHPTLSVSYFQRYMILGSYSYSGNVSSRVNQKSLLENSFRLIVRSTSAASCLIYVDFYLYGGQNGVSTIRVSDKLRVTDLKTKDVRVFVSGQKL